MNIDRRFLNISLVVNGIVNEPPASPVPIKGTQYIVGDSGTGAFGSADENDIARYNGTAWTFTKPKTGNLEVFNLATLEILTWNGTAWTVSVKLKRDTGENASNSKTPELITVKEIIEVGEGEPDSEVELHYDTASESYVSDDYGKLYYDMDEEKLYILWNTWKTPAQGWIEASLQNEDIQYALRNHTFLGITNTSPIEYYLYSFDEDCTMSESSEINNGSIIIVSQTASGYKKDTGRTFIFNADIRQLIELSNTDNDSSASTSSGVYIGTYTLTASDITSQFFTLPSKPALINNVRAVFVSVGGVTQTQGVDYRVVYDSNTQTSTLRWDSSNDNQVIPMGLNDIGLVAGDVLTIMYQVDATV